MSSRWRPTIAEVDLDVFHENVASFVALVSPAMVCAVVKADGYGHGAVPCARTAIEAGAKWLGVALVEEAVELRDAGITAPILVLSEFPDAAFDTVVGRNITPTVYSEHKIALVARAASALHKSIGVHIKVDTGMHRVGAQPSEVLALVSQVLANSSLTLGGVFTHFAVADVVDDPFTGLQLIRFNQVLSGLRAAGIDPGIVHASNSAATLAHDRARFDMVRVGVALYGNNPDSRLAADHYGVTLRPILKLRSAVSHVKVVAAHERLSYGLRYELSTDSIVATVPIGYADGLPRRLSDVGGEVLIGGRQLPIAGRITMDQILVDCGPPDPIHRIEIGDEVVVIGNQGNERITPWDVAMKLNTIAYEITCGISKRVPRTYTSGK